MANVYARGRTEVWLVQKAFGCELSNLMLMSDGVILSKVGLRRWKRSRRLAFGVSPITWLEEKLRQGWTHIPPSDCKRDIHYNKVNNKRDWYRNEYLKSDHWAKLKASKLEQKPECQRCGSVLNLDVHHVKYKNVVDVQLSDLQTLCRPCHDLEHANLDAAKQSKTQAYPTKRVFHAGSSKRWTDPNRRFSSENKQINAIKAGILKAASYR